VFVCTTYSALPYFICVAHILGVQNNGTIFTRSNVRTLVCDIKFETDDGEIVIGHANVLIVASWYFLEMFTNFDERCKELINLRKLDSIILKLSVYYIYTGEIMVTKGYVQV